MFNIHEIQAPCVVHGVRMPLGEFVALYRQSVPDGVLIGALLAAPKRRLFVRELELRYFDPRDGVRNALFQLAIFSVPGVEIAGPFMLFGIPSWELERAEALARTHELAIARRVEDLPPGELSLFGFPVVLGVHALISTGRLAQTIAAINRDVERDSLLAAYTWKPVLDELEREEGEAMRQLMIYYESGEWPEIAPAKPPACGG